MPPGVEQFGRKKSAGAPIPTSALIGLASGNLQPMGELLAGAVAITFFDISTNRTGRPNKLHNNHLPAPVPDRPVRILNGAVVKFQRLYVKWIAQQWVRR